MMTYPAPAQASCNQPQRAPAIVTDVDLALHEEMIGEELELAISDSDTHIDADLDLCEPTLIQRRRRRRPKPPLLGNTFPCDHLLRGRYRLRHEIGRGGMGAVIAAYDERTGRDVAIKLLLPELLSDEELVARFQREAVALAAIDHPNVCKLYDVGKVPSGAPFMVLERLYGQDLADVLAAEGRLAPARALDYALQACRAVAAAHKAGVIHRDLKPENLFVAERRDGTHCIKVLDFGLSKVASAPERPRSRQLTADAQVMGTPCYMAPEQWSHCNQVGPATDQWALASILFELISGTAPFTGKTITEVYLNVKDRPTPSLLRRRPAVARRLELVLFKALEKEPEARYPDVETLAKALEAFVPPSTRPHDDTSPTLPRRTDSDMPVQSDPEATRPLIARTTPGAQPGVEPGVEPPSRTEQMLPPARPPRRKQQKKRRWSPTRILAAAAAVATLVLGVGWAVSVARADTTMAQPQRQTSAPTHAHHRAQPGQVQALNALSLDAQR